jgi:hypothetical protein
MDVRWSRYSNLEDSRFTTLKCRPGKGLAEEVVEALGDELLLKFLVLLWVW